MKRMLILFVLFLCTILAGCSYAVEPQESDFASPSLTVVATPTPTPTSTPSPFPIELTALPEEYPPEEAAANGDYVSVHGVQYFNEEKLTAFLDAVSTKNSAAIRTVGYTDEGDPIISDVIFDGSKFTLWSDTTRDQFGIRKIEQYEYKNILEYEREDGRIIFLTNESEVTKDLLENIDLEFYPLTTRKITPSPTSY